MGQFKSTPNGYLLNGKPFYLNSGEVHYFRIKASLWEKHLTKLKESGCNTVSTYICWSFHEIKEGTFDFTGKTRPERNILGFLDLAKRLGLWITVKPGPYILAEYLDQGIPRWLIKKHPEIQVMDAWGGFNNPFVSSFMHPTYIKYSLKWYDKILPHLAKRQIQSGGNVIQIQVCNEVGLQQWLTGSGDYNPATLVYYYQFLKNKYKTIQKLSKVYKTDDTQFSDVIPPSGNTDSKEDFVRFQDWHDFHRWYYAVYLKFLIKEIRQRGIKLQIYHNIPGWVYGRALEYPVNITLYSEAIKMCPEIVFGVDHIPETINFRNFHDDLIVNKMVKSLQNNRHALFSAEFQAGSREHVVRTYPKELELFYKASLAHGLQGFNYYMFSQGINPDNGGVFGPKFYWFNMLDAQGNDEPLLPVAQRMSRLINPHVNKWILSNDHAELGVVFYKPYYQTEFYYPIFAKVQHLIPHLAGLDYDPKSIRDHFYFEGLLRVLQMQNIDFDMPDIEQMSLKELNKYKQLWVMSLDIMDAKSQKLILNYVKNGGTAIVFPTLPKYDLNLNDCQILRKGFQIQEKTSIFEFDSKTRILNEPPVSMLSRFNIYSKKDGKPFAKTMSGKICGISKKVGKGQVYMLGTAIPYTVEEQIDVYQKIFDLNQIKPQVKTTEKNIVSLKRQSNEGSFVSLLNYHNESYSIKIKTQDKEGKWIQFPSYGKVDVPHVSGKILPFEWSFKKSGIDLVYSTCEIYETNDTKTKVVLNLAPVDQESEIALRCKKEIKKILISDQVINSSNKKGLVIFSIPKSLTEKTLTIIV